MIAGKVSSPTWNGPLIATEMPNKRPHLPLVEEPPNHSHERKESASHQPALIGRWQKKRGARQKQFHSSGRIDTAASAEKRDPPGKRAAAAPRRTPPSMTVPDSVLSCRFRRRVSPPRPPLRSAGSRAFAVEHLCRLPRNEGQRQGDEASRKAQSDSTASA